ncbi:MAG: YeeE/YedE thiosulfate transporter family protein [Bacteroidota bacterium]|nr:YeeE/YedE thiosulfate transporter family protein [Bacteroidota bacterium]
MEFIAQPWPWYGAGPLIGLVVPLLLILGNKPFGISSTFKHICAMCTPVKVPFFDYDWKKEIWNLYFVGGILIGSFVAMFVIGHPDYLKLNPDTISQLTTEGLTDFKGLMPTEIFSWSSLITVKGFIFIVIGGFLVGFGTRYGNGCTSGHAITGIANLQWVSLLATICFMTGGFITTHLILPYLLAL